MVVIGYYRLLSIYIGTFQAEIDPAPRARRADRRVRLPRDLTGRDLSTLLRRHFAYEVVRQSGNPLRLSTAVSGEHRITVPAGGPLRVGTLAAISAT